MLMRLLADPLTVAPPEPTEGLEEDPEEDDPEDEEPEEELLPVTVGALAGFFLASDDSSFAMVWAPTTPSWDRLLYLWNCFTAASVADP